MTIRYAIQTAPVTQSITPYKFAGISLLLLLSAMCSCERDGWRRSEIDASMKIGETIVSAIESYKKAEGRYPEALQDLVPAYLNEIPPARTGSKEFGYFLHPEADRYSLEFGADETMYPSVYYDSRKGRWLADN